MQHICQFPSLHFHIFPKGFTVSPMEKKILIFFLKIFLKNLFFKIFFQFFFFFSFFQFFKKYSFKIAPSNNTFSKLQVQVNTKIQKKKRLKYIFKMAGLKISQIIQFQNSSLKKYIFKIAFS